MLLALSATLTSATKLFIADYYGTITTASLTAANGEYSFTKTSEAKGCAPNPSWLTADTNRGLLFCMNEGLTSPIGSLASFTINDDASIKFVKNETSLNGPVSGVIYGHPAGQRGIALAHYVGSGVSSWLLKGSGKFEHNQDIVFDGPLGPDPARQDAPHAHETITDPTGQYILVPDLGSDLVRTFSWDRKTLKLEALESLEATPGYGPRHAVFWNPSGLAGEKSTTYMFLVGELSGSVTSFAVTYKANGGGLDFKNITNSVIDGNKLNAPAEIEVSPDNRFLIISNRDTSFTDQDSLASYVINKDGTLSGKQLTPVKTAEGAYPRHFSLNKAGNVVAVGLQYANETLILERNVTSGEIIQEPVARLQAGANVTNVLWAESLDGPASGLLGAGSGQQPLP